MIKFARSMSILALASLAFGGPAYAKAPPKSQPSASQSKTVQLMQSYRQKVQQLRGIQQKAVKNTPALSAEMKHFQTEVQASMRAHGFDVAKEKPRFEAMVAKLKSGKDAAGKKLSKTERDSTMKDLQAERQKLMAARNAVMKDSKIQKDRQAIHDHMIAAMKKQDSHTDQLLKDVKSLRAQISAAMQARRATAKKSG